MAAPVRRAGHGELPDGSRLTWSVAEGAKGRRWREVVVRDGSVVHSLLVETFPDGRFAHLELSTAAGLLTLHPEGDGTLHGNTVTGDGIGHVRGRPWPPGSVVVVAGSVIAAAAALHARGPNDVPVTVVGRDLSLASEVIAASVLADRAGPLDADGLPCAQHATSWPLEED